MFTDTFVIFIIPICQSHFLNVAKTKQRQQNFKQGFNEKNTFYENLTLKKRSEVQSNVIFRIPIYNFPYAYNQTLQL